jgi:hypothetical protein
MGETKADILPERATGPRTPGVWVSVAALVVLGVGIDVAGRFVGPERLAAGGWGTRIAAVVAAALLGTAAWAFARFLVRTLTSLPFAVAVLGLVLASTMLGTFVLQNVPPGEYAAKYGSRLTSIILGLGFNDIFHSAWFTGWLFVLAVSLVMVPVRYRAWRTPQWGHAAAHLGLVLILAGCFVGVRWGVKGFIELHEGESADTAVVQGRPASATAPDRGALGFTLRLVDFSTEYYPPEACFQVYEHGENASRLRKSVKAKAAASWTPTGVGDVRFRVARAIPASRGVESHVLVVQKDDLSPPEEIPVQPGGAFRVAGGAWQVRVLAYYPDFIYDMEKREAATRSQQPNNPALEVEVTPGNGGTAEIRRLYARMPDFDHREGAERKGPRLLYRYIPAEVPAQLEIEIQSSQGNGTHRFAENGSEPMLLPDGRHVLAYVIKRDEVKAYRSKLAVLEGGRPVLEKTIAVNDPLTYRGWSFYQANYRKEDPTYSGIQVVRDPGLPAVWAGLILLCVGVVYIYYVRPRLKQAKAAAPAVPSSAE